MANLLGKYCWSVVIAYRDGKQIEVVFDTREEARSYKRTVNYRTALKYMQMYKVVSISEDGSQVYKIPKS